MRPQSHDMNTAGLAASGLPAQTAYTCLAFVNQVLEDHFFSASEKKEEELFVARLEWSKIRSYRNPQYVQQ